MRTTPTFLFAVLLSLPAPLAAQDEVAAAAPSRCTAPEYRQFDFWLGEWEVTSNETPAGTNSIVAWVDASGTLLLLDGGIVDGAMVLEGERPAPGGKGIVRHRIAWTPNEDGTVRQLWEASQDGGANWSMIFDGLYTRAGGVE
jgi:hypothetical protein